jgi:hypothetical protein
LRLYGCNSPASTTATRRPLRPRLRRNNYTSAASTLIHCKDYIVIFMDSSCSRAQHRALAIIDSVCIDLDHADHATPDKSQVIPYQELVFVLLSPHPVLGGYAMQANITQGIDYALRPHRLHLRRVDSGPLCQIQSSAVSTLVSRVEYISAYRRLAQTRLPRPGGFALKKILRPTLGGFTLKMCIYSHSGALTKGYGSRQQIAKILRASPSASTSTHPRGLLGR